jgi:sterol desaturase/sphingolipid hydroxylase (fatty acid hydroxylase superfamily)
MARKNAGAYLSLMSDEHIQEFLHEHEKQHHHGRAQSAPIDKARSTRIIVWTAVILVISFLAMTWVSNTNRDSLPKGLMVFALGVAIVPFIASPIEWLVHRFIYHQPVIRTLSRIYSVHTAHHYAYFPPWRYITGGSARRLSLSSDLGSNAEDPIANAIIRVLHFGWYMTFGVVFMWIPAWFITHDGVFLGGIIVSSIVVSNLFIVVHDTIHRPGSHRIVEAQPWFNFLDQHHYIHHVALGSNLNFLLPLADALFGTLRLRLTDEELRAHGSLKRAKLLRVGEGEPARY